MQKVTGFMILFSIVGIDWTVKSPIGIRGQVNLRGEVHFMFFSGITRTPVPITSTAGEGGLMSQNQFQRFYSAMTVFKGKTGKESQWIIEAKC